eukprot:365012-Chlamydomonas_euryale.AAC.1
MKHGADVNCVKITDIHEGVDFFFANRAHACKLVDFLQSVVPVRFRTDKQLVSHDTHNNTYNYKYTFSVEIIPVCKDDLVFLPAKLKSNVYDGYPVIRTRLCYACWRFARFMNHDRVHDKFGARACTAG